MIRFNLFLLLLACSTMICAKEVDVEIDGDINEHHWSPPQRSAIIMPQVSLEGSIFYVRTPVTTECVELSIIDAEGMTVWSSCSVEPSRCHVFYATTLAPETSYSIAITIGDQRWIGNVTLED